MKTTTTHLNLTAIMLAVAITTNAVELPHADGSFQPLAKLGLLVGIRRFERQ